MDIQDQTTIPEVKQTIVKLRELNADEQLKAQAFYREKRLHDEASALGYARREGEKMGLAKGEAIGLAKGEAIGLARGETIGLKKGKLQLIEELKNQWLLDGRSEKEISELLRNFAE